MTIDARGLHSGIAGAYLHGKRLVGIRWCCGETAGEARTGELDAPCWWAIIPVHHLHVDERDRRALLLRYGHLRSAQGTALSPGLVKR